MTTAADPTPFRGTELDFARIAAAEDAEMLRELAQIGMRLARLVEENAEAKMALDPAANLGRADQAFAKIARSVRQTLALKVKLAEMAAKREAAVESGEEGREAESARLHRRKVKLVRAIEESIAAEAENGRTDAEHLLTDLHERLDDADILADLGARPMGEMVAGICDDLGIPVNRAVWQAKGWYLTENWRPRLGSDSSPPVAPVPERSLAEITAEALAMMDATTHGPPPDRGADAWPGSSVAPGPASDDVGHG